MTAPAPGPTNDSWPLVFIGRTRPRGRHGQRCKRIRRGDRSSGTTLVKFATDGSTYWVLDTMLVKAELY